MIRLLTIALLLIAIGVHGAERYTIGSYADKLAPLIDPAKLATLGQRGANPRIQKAVAIPADAQADKLDLRAVCAAAICKGKDETHAG